MPFGISESAIAKAYGPTDLSGIYKGIDNAVKKYDAETKAQKQADLKEYYTNSASLNKDTEGVRAIDKPKLINLMNEWSDVSKKQMNINIKNNPEDWGKFENRKNELKSQIGTISAGSKELIKASKEYGEKMLNPNTKYDYEEGAFENWKKNVDNQTYEQVVAGNHHDISNYFRKDVDGSKFYEGVQKSHQEKGSTEDVKVPAKSYKDKSTGTELVDYNIYKKVPKPDAIHNNIDLNLEDKFKSPGQRTRFIKQELGKLITSGEGDGILKKWNALSDDSFAQLGMGKKPEFNFQGNDKETFVNLLAAKEIINSMPTAPSEIKAGEFKGGKFAEEEYKGKKQLQREFAVIDYKDKKGQINVGRLESALGSVMHNVKDGDLKNAYKQALAMQQSAKNPDTKYVVYKPGGDEEINNKALQQIASKINTSTVSGQVTHPTVDQLKSKSNSELAKLFNVSEDDLNKGLFISAYGGATPGVAVYPMNSEGYSGLVQEVGHTLDPKDMKSLLDKNIDYIISKGADANKPATAPAKPGGKSKKSKYGGTPR